MTGMAILRTTIVDYREFSMLFKDDAIQRKMPLKLPHIQCFASKCPCKLGFWLSITTVVFEPNSKSYLSAEDVYYKTYLWDENQHINDFQKLASQKCQFPLFPQTAMMNMMALNS